MGIWQAIRRTLSRPPAPLDRTGPATVYGHQAGAYPPDRSAWPLPDADPWPVVNADPASDRPDAR